MPAWGMRRAWPWLVALTVVAAAVRLPAIGRESLWFDEAVSYLAATLPVGRILDNTVQSSHPPLYYLLLHAWLKIVPRTDGAARLLGTAWNVLLVPALYWLAVELYGDHRRGLYAALLVALSPFHILYSHELRMYTQLMLLVTAGAAAYMRARRTGATGWWLVSGGAYLAAVYTHLFAFLALGAVGLHALTRHRERGALWRTALLGVAVAVLFLPWARLLWVEAETELGSMRPLSQAASASGAPSTRGAPLARGVPLVRLAKALTAPAFLVFGRSVTPAYSAFAYFSTLSIAVVLPLAARKRWREGEHTGLALPALMVLYLLGIPVVAYWIRPFFLPDRTMAAASPFLLALITWGLTERDSPLPYIAYAVAGAMVVGWVLYLTGDRIKPPYREAMGLIAQEYVEGDAVLHTSDGSYLPALRYTDLPAHGVLEGDPDPRKPRAVYEQLGGEVWSLEEAGESGARLWVVVALEHSVEWQTTQAERMRREYGLLRSYDVAGIGIWLYDTAQGSAVP